jgi:hypothetical protein
MPDLDPIVAVSDGSPHVEIERRKHIRYKVAALPRIRFLTQPGFCFDHGLLKDISASGLCLIVDHVLPVAAQLVVQLPGRRRGNSLSRSARVLRVESDSAGRWLVGCQLSSLLSDEEVRDLRAGCESTS